MPSQPLTLGKSRVFQETAASAGIAPEQGLAASESAGRPISVKFIQMEDRKPQLSVYPMKGDGYSEVVVDHGTGRVMKTVAITSGSSRRRTS